MNFLNVTVSWEHHLLCKWTEMPHKNNIDHCYLGEKITSFLPYSLIFFILLQLNGLGRSFKMENKVSIWKCQVQNWKVIAGSTFLPYCQQVCTETQPITCCNSRRHFRVVCLAVTFIPDLRGWFSNSHLLSILPLLGSFSASSSDHIIFVPF